MKLDIDFVRAQFDQLKDDPDFVFASNAGGSYVSNQVNRVMEHYNHHTRVQPYSRFTPSAEAGRKWTALITAGRRRSILRPTSSP